jgi:hypothetical protein
VDSKGNIVVVENTAIGVLVEGEEVNNKRERVMMHRGKKNNPTEDR